MEEQSQSLRFQILSLNTASHSDVLYFQLAGTEVRSKVYSHFYVAKYIQPQRFPLYQAVYHEKHFQIEVLVRVFNYTSNLFLLGFSGQ